MSDPGLIALGFVGGVFFTLVALILSEMVNALSDRKDTRGKLDTYTPRED